jgi:hypothetical protein
VKERLRRFLGDAFREDRAVSIDLLTLIDGARAGEEGDDARAHETSLRAGGCHTEECSRTASPRPDKRPTAPLHLAGGLARRVPARFVVVVVAARSHREVKSFF